MKKAIVNQLRDLAQALPERWEPQQPEVKRISGKALNLCTKGRPYKDTDLYEYQVPVSLKVDHLSRLKDGVKRHGLEYISTYTKEVLN